MLTEGYYFCWLQALLLCADNLMLISSSFMKHFVVLHLRFGIKPVLGFMFTVAVQFLDH